MKCFNLFVLLGLCPMMAVGQRVKLIVPQLNQKAGTYSVQTSVADLPTGTYAVKITSGKQVESKQLIIN